MQFKISRRDFMKMTGAVAAGVIAGGGDMIGTGSIATKRVYASGLTYAGKELPILYEADCCVIGGGPSGAAAAIMAARNGAKTVLVERGIALGGLQTLGLVIPFMPTFAPDSDTPYVAEVKKRLKDNGVEISDGVTDFVWTNPEVFSVIYDEMCEEADVEVLYNTTFTDVLMDGDTITACVVNTIDGLMAVKAKTYVDGSGDAILARTAGVPSEKGSEKTGRNQPMSFRFEIAGIDYDKLYKHVSIKLGDTWCKTKPPHYEIAEARHRTQRYVLEKFMTDGVACGELTEADAEYMQGFSILGKPGTMAMNCPELPFEFSATDPLSYSRGVREGRKMIRRITNYFIKHMPGFENAYLSHEASMLGARESWRIRGKLYMTEDDYHGQSRYADAVVRTAWFIDAHGERVDEKLPKGAYYEIPYRAMVSDKVRNLVVGGRCISASFVLQASMRIQPTCMSIGEAAGIASAWAVKHGIDANAVQWDKLPNSVRSYISK